MALNRICLLKVFVVHFLILLCTYSVKAVFMPQRYNRIEDVYLRFYNGLTVNERVEVPLQQATTLLGVNGFQKNNPTVIYAHGYIESSEEESIQVVVTAYLQARPGTNVILLDWTNMAGGLYLLNAARNTKTVGVAMAEQLNKLLEAGLALDRVHLIGFSLGAQVAGYIARELKNRYYKTIKRVTALDPAFPGFYPDNAVVTHINANDAEFVDVIHTDAMGYGAPVPTGTVDFWPNGGKGIQPGCPLFAPVPLSEYNLCSHMRSWRFYAESILNPTAFPASPARSLIFRFNSNPAVGIVYMGIGCDTNASGSYYLTTNAQSPFGRGSYGLYG